MLQICRKKALGWDAFGKERFGSGRVLSVGRWQTRSEASGNDLEGSGFDAFSFTEPPEVRVLVMNGSRVRSGRSYRYLGSIRFQEFVLRFRRFPEGSKRCWR